MRRRRSRQDRGGPAWNRAEREVSRGAARLCAGVHRGAGDGRARSADHGENGAEPGRRHGAERGAVGRTGRRRVTAGAAGSGQRRHRHAQRVRQGGRPRRTAVQPAHPAPVLQRRGGEAVGGDPGAARRRGVRHRTDDRRGVAGHPRDRRGGLVAGHVGKVTRAGPAELRGEVGADLVERRLRLVAEAADARGVGVAAVQRLVDVGDHSGQIDGRCRARRRDTVDGRVDDAAGVLDRLVHVVRHRVVERTRGGQLHRAQPVTGLGVGGRRGRGQQPRRGGAGHDATEHEQTARDDAPHSGCRLGANSCHDWVPVPLVWGWGGSASAECRNGHATFSLAVHDAGCQTTGVRREREAGTSHDRVTNTACSRKSRSVIDRAQSRFSTRAAPAAAVDARIHPTAIRTPAIHCDDPTIRHMPS